MHIYELTGEAKENAIKLVIDELNRTGIKLDADNNSHRHIAVALATNLRIRFNENGYLR